MLTTHQLVETHGLIALDQAQMRRLADGLDDRCAAARSELLLVNEGVSHAQGPQRFNRCFVGETSKVVIVSFVAGWDEATVAVQHWSPVSRSVQHVRGIEKDPIWCVEGKLNDNRIRCRAQAFVQRRYRIRTDVTNRCRKA